MSGPRLVRYRSPVPDDSGRYVGVFGLVNRLGRSGRLGADDEALRRSWNAWYDAAYTNPAAVDPGVYAPSVNPLAAAWFKRTAAHLLEPVSCYLDILDRHGVVWERCESDDPGRVLYEDDVQVVVVPW